jgi:hypothetical protein
VRQFRGDAPALAALQPGQAVARHGAACARRVVHNSTGTSAAAERRDISSATYGGDDTGQRTAPIPFVLKPNRSLIRAVRTTAYSCGRKSAFPLWYSDGRPRLSVRQPGGNTMRPDAPLRVIELNVPPATKEYPRTSITTDVLARLKPVEWHAHWEGNLGPGWHLEVHQSKFFSHPRSMPGTVGSPASTTPRSVVVGISFNLSVIQEKVREVPCLVGCLVWAALDDQIWCDVLVTLRQKESKLKGLYPYPDQEPTIPDGTPFLILMRTLAWRCLSENEKTELCEWVPSIGWSAIQALSHEEC